MHNAIKCVNTKDVVRDHLQSWCPTVLIKIIDQYMITTVTGILCNRGLTDDNDVSHLYTLIERLFSDRRPATTAPITAITGTGYAECFGLSHRAMIFTWNNSLVETCSK